MKNMRKIKKTTKEQKNGQSGITLIALVVTIIVLLLLAGISINMISGNSSLFKNAEDAKNKTTQAQIEEAIKLSYISALAREKSTKTETFNATMKEELGKHGYKDAEVDITNNSVKINGEKYTIGNIPTTEGKTLVSMFKQAQIDNCNNADGLCTNEGHLHIGDYVNFKNPTTGSIEISSSDSGLSRYTSLGITNQVYNISDNQLNWRVLGLNTSEEIELVSGSPMKKANTTEGNSSPYLHLYGAEGYINGTKILNDICEMYKKYDTTGLVSTARSINTDDVDKILGLTTLELKKQYNIDSYLGGRNIGDSYSFDNQYTPESSLTNTKLTITGNITGYQYTINKRIADDFPYVTIENERVFNMMFANIDTDDKPYWLANQTVTSTYSYVWYSLGVIQTDMDCPSVGHVMLIRSQDKHEIVQKYGVRPVISLKSSTTTEQLKKVSDKTEISWK